jgi:hypothetical protein
MNNSYKNRFKCPCCGYPTLSEKSSYEICILCNWEDDGQNDSNADEVFGGPNGSYSLTEARNNYRQYTIMYNPGNNTRLTGRDTEEEISVKKELMKAFDAYSESFNLSEMMLLCGKIEGYERRLNEITHERVKEYEKRIKLKESDT